MNSVYKDICKDEVYLNEDKTSIMCKCKICGEEMFFSNTYSCYKIGEKMIYGHKRCIMLYDSGK